MTLRTNYDEAASMARAEAAIEEARQRHDFNRGATPIGADDDAEKIARIEAALPTASERDRRLLERVLLRLRAARGFVPTLAVAAE